MQPVRENIREYHYDLEVEKDFSNIIQKSLTKKEEITDWTTLKIKIFVPQRVPLRKRGGSYA